MDLTWSLIGFACIDMNSNSFTKIHMHFDIFIWFSMFLGAWCAQQACHRHFAPGQKAILDLWTMSILAVLRIASLSGCLSFGPV